MVVFISPKQIVKARRSFAVKEDHIGSVVSKIVCYKHTHTDRHPVTFSKQLRSLIHVKMLMIGTQAGTYIIEGYN